MDTLLLSLAGLLLLLALTGGLLRRMGISAIPAWILLGLATGTAVANPEVVHFVEAAGIALLLFFVGLEFSVLRLRRMARRMAAAGGIDLLVNLPVGILGGLLLGWDLDAALLLGAALYISSSAIVAQNVASFGRAANPETEIALGVLIAEDLILALLLAAAALWPPFAVEGVSPTVTALGVAGLALSVTVLAGPLTRGFDRLAGHAPDEILLLGTLGVVLLFAGAGLATGLSEAVGAFVAGLLVGDSALKGRVEALLAPFRGLFAALFFFAFGLGIEPATLLPVLVPGLVLGAGAFVAKLAGGLWIGRRESLSPAASLNLGITLSPRGEFSVLLAAYGPAAGHGELPSLVAVVVVLLALGGTLLTQAGPRTSQAAVTRLRALRARLRREEAPSHGSVPDRGPDPAGSSRDSPRSRSRP